MEQDVKQKDAPKVIKKTILKILPYIDANTDNMGLTKHKMVLHDGANHLEQLTCLEVNGTRRYLTGLNEFAPEIELLADEDKKHALITEIRKNVIFLEKALGANVVAIDDEKFWEKVKTVHPSNHAFWDNVFISPSNEPVFLDPTKPDDLIKICAIKAGGFSIVAKSFEDARMAATPPKFYLDEATDTAVSKNEETKLKNKAVTALQNLDEKDHKKMFYVVKNIDNNSAQYKNGTSMEIIYNNLNAFITGNGSEVSVKKAAQRFLNICKLPLDDLKINAVVSDANFYRYIVQKGDGLLYHNQTNSMVGRNAVECLEYFKNTLNSKIWDAVRTEVEAHWKE